MATPRSYPYPYPLFKAVLRKLLEAATKGGEAKGGKEATAAADMDTADDADSAEATQRGLLELLLCMAPSLQVAHLPDPNPSPNPNPHANPNPNLPRGRDARGVARQPASRAG